MADKQKPERIVLVYFQSTAMVFKVDHFELYTQRRNARHLMSGTTLACQVFAAELGKEGAIVRSAVCYGDQNLDHLPPTVRVSLSTWRDIPLDIKFN